MTLFIAFILLFVIGWEVFWWSAGVKPISPWQLKRILQSRRDDLTLVDVRTRPEYRWFHIDGVPNCPELLTRPQGLQTDDPTRPIVIVCMSGHRSPIVGYRLKRLGFRDVSYLSWGMIGWWISGRISR